MATLIRHSAFSGENCEPLYIKGLRPEEDEKRMVEKFELWMKDGLGLEVELDEWQSYFLNLIHKDQSRARSRRKPSL